MVKLQIGVSIFICDTAEEAVRIHRLVNGSAVPQVAAEAVVERRNVPKNGKNGHAMQFIKKLEPYVGQELSSEEMAKVTGAKGPTGLGPKMAQLKKKLAGDGVMLEDFILRKKPDAASPVTWTVLKAAA